MNKTADMEEKVQTVLKLLEEEGDSFAKRAEMCYKRRPELISFVDESFKAYRALAEGYDHISTELQNANNTIASVFPDRVPFMDEEDDDGSPRPSRKKAEGYWETDEQIKEFQERVSTLQDELGEGVDIEDDEARHLMAEVALKSCQEA
ncbi:hypothetical protein JHK84_034054 [Glycine max]|nr:hypothetical protein JHK86_033794 [Glycine max]KAG5140286.1 hypothetical protein JHK84_034054 [Glycine max]